MVWFSFHCWLDSFMGNILSSKRTQIPTLLCSEQTMTIQHLLFPWLQGFRVWASGSAFFPWSFFFHSSSLRPFLLNTINRAHIGRENPVSGKILILYPMHLDMKKMTISPPPFFSFLFGKNSTQNFPEMDLYSREASSLYR